MIVRRLCVVLLLSQGLLAATCGEEADPILPTTTPPIVYVIDYTGEYFKRPDYLERFKAAPPDLLHVGKATPITHHWGPIRLYQGENQYTGGPGHTLGRENIALLTPEALAARIERIRQTLNRYHGIGISEIVPYISYHTLAGDHQKRLGFWKFYDQWDNYSKWAGPRPEHDPLDWLVVDRRGEFVGGSCGGYSPDYYAPLHRYRACLNHPDWAEWHRRLVRMIAEVGYDGVFVDNTHPDSCFCRYCKARFREFLHKNRDMDWVRRLTKELDIDSLALESKDVPAELVRRWRLLRTAEHLGVLREVGRKVKPTFTVFPNSGNINECLCVGSRCDRLMFESTSSPGILAHGDPSVTGEIRVVVSSAPVKPKRLTHRLEMNDPASWTEIEADISIPNRAQTEQTAGFEVKILSIGHSLQDGDAAEDFYLLLREVDDGEEVRIELKPAGPVGGTGSSRKPRQPPVVITGTWTPKQTGSYAIFFGFRYTDDGHGKQGVLHPHLVRLLPTQSCRTHQAELLFTQQMHARTIYLGYEALRSGWENVQELALAELAAFSGGGGFSGRGRPLTKYRAFFKTHPELFDGWCQTAPAAVLYAYWGQNPLSPQRSSGPALIHTHLGATHRLFAALVDANLPAAAEGLATFDVIYLQAPSYEMSPRQLGSLRNYVKQGGRLVISNAKITINGRPISQIFGLREGRPKRDLGRGEVLLWSWREPATPTAPVAAADGLRSNLRFALYRKGECLALHVINYNVCLFDKKKPVLDVDETPVEIPLPAGFSAVTATCFDPDAQKQMVPCTVSDGLARLRLPKTHIYKIVLIEKK